MLKLRIFAFADIHSPETLHLSEIKPEKYDVILTLGDISSETFDYISYMARLVKIYGVLGNHDPKEIPGLNNIHCKTVVLKDKIRLGGFGGAPKYENHPNTIRKKTWQER